MTASATSAPNCCRCFSSSTPELAASRPTWLRRSRPRWSCSPLTGFLRLFERRLPDWLASTDNPQHHRLLKRFATWHLGRFFRLTVANAPLTSYRVNNARHILRQAASFLGFLAAERQQIGERTHADIDRWLLPTPVPPGSATSPVTTPGTYDKMNTHTQEADDMAAARKRATSGEVGLALAVRNNLLAIVFDANCFGEGLPDLDQLSFFARRLGEIDLPVWIPQPVAWEWAEHLAQDWSKAQTAISAANRTLAKSNLAQFQTEFAGAEDVATKFLAQLDEIPNVEVIKLSPEHALAGLRDQVLQRPPAKRKGTVNERVKTGASDSAWIREVLARAENDPTRLLFITEDRDVETALAAWGHETILVRPKKDLFATLFTVTVDAGGAAEVVLRYLVERLPADQGAEVLDLGAVINLANVAELLLPPDIERIDNIALTRITGVAGIFAVLVEEDTGKAADETAVSMLAPGNTAHAVGASQGRGLYDQIDRQTPHIAVATVLLLAEAQATTITDLQHSRQTTGTHLVRDVLLRTDLFVDLKAGKVVELQPDSTIAIDSADAFDDDADALESFVESLYDVIPGLEFPDSWPFEAGTEFERDVNGHHVNVAYSAADAGEWTVQVTIDHSETAEIGCYYNVDARVWDAPESFDMPGAYPITLNIADSPNPFWAFSSWVINRIYGRRSTVVGR